MKRIILAGLLCSCLSGCFFIWIPGSMLQSGNTCVTEAAYVGQRINNRQNGKAGTVKELHGRSGSCQSAEMPIKATVDYDTL